MAPEWAKANRPLVADLHRHHLPGHDPVQGGRDRAGRRVRDRRAGAHGVGRAGGHARTPTARGRPWMRLPGAHDRVRVHDGRQHHRAARRHQDRVDLHRRHHRHVADVAGGAVDRAARPRGGRRRRGAARSSTKRPSRRSGSSRTGPTSATARSTTTSCARRASRTTFRPTSACCSSKCARATSPSSQTG